MGSQLEPNGAYSPPRRFWLRNNPVKYKSLKADCVWLITSYKGKSYLFTLSILKVTVDLKLPLHEIEGFWKNNWLSDNEAQQARETMLKNKLKEKQLTENIKVCMYSKEKAVVPCIFSPATILCCSWNGSLPGRSLTYLSLRSCSVDFGSYRRTLDYYLFLDVLWELPYIVVTI